MLFRRLSVKALTAQTRHPKGIEVNSVDVVEWQKQDAVKFTFTNMNNSKKESDLLVGVERAILTERRDIVRVNDALLAAPLWIDMGLAAPESFGKKDFDELSFADVSNGLTIVNGAARANGENGPIATGFFGTIAEYTRYPTLSFGYSAGCGHFGCV